MRARSTNILDSTYITPVVQASSKTRAAMLMLAYNAPRKPQMCHNAVRTHRPTWTIGTRYCAAQVTSACSYKCVPECDRLSAHRTREGPGGIRRYARAQAAAGELWLHDNGASNTSMPIATTTCAARCSLALQPVPARLARPDCVSEACSGSLR
jgi:hypothetical protein